MKTVKIQIEDLVRASFEVHPHSGEIKTGVQQIIDFTRALRRTTLEEAAKKAETYYEPHWSGEQEGSSYVDRDSILCIPWDEIDTTP